MLIVLSFGRKTFFKDQKPRVVTSTYSGYDAEFCTYDIITSDAAYENYACLDTQTQLEWGWNYEQDYDYWDGDTHLYYRLRNNIYTE